MTALKKMEKYYSQHVWYAKIVGLVIGIGVGILITYPLAGAHPVRWGFTFLVVGALAGLAPYFEK